MSKPNKIQTVLSVAACKLTRSILRKTGRGGTAIPGTIAMKFSRNILSTVTEGMDIIVVTGTNGKTTTCNMIEHAITASGRECLRDKSGANMLQGIAADMVCSATWDGKPTRRFAVLEVDEGALKLVAPLVKPKVIVVTNLFSDQVDRYGSVQNTLKEIRTGIELVPESTLVLNADEPLSTSITCTADNPVIWFGMNGQVGELGNIDLSDAGVCPVCGSSYSYDFHIYAHLGGFRCKKCGYVRHDPDVEVEQISHAGADGSDVLLKTWDSQQSAHIALPANYNIYNAAAAIAAVKVLGIGPEEAAASLSTVRSAFGRMETFSLDGIRLQMILVKNTAGCNQALSYLTSLDEDFTAVLCLNNQTGDGHDISWIESTDYEKLVADPHLKKLYVCGECASELSARLRTAGAGDDLQEIVTDYSLLCEKLKADGRPVFALPNYTAMMDLRKVLTAQTENKDFWE